MPRSLFLKIFLWFSAVLFTVIVGTFMVGELARPEPFHRPPRIPIEPALAGYARTAADVWERDGRDGLIPYFERVERESGIRVFLFNRQLEELSGRRIPAGAPDVAQRSFEMRHPEHGPHDAGPLIATRVTSLSGADYALVAELSRRAPPESIFHPIMHLVAIILIGGLFCYWLARYLTSPVGKLRAATQELAKGNLSVRVGPAMGKRRDELAALAVDFDLMAERIESLIDSQRRLLGDISHELRSPLARLNVALELARQRSGAEAASALERIQYEAENLNEMIGQVLALTRLESGSAGLNTAQVDLLKLLTTVTEDAQFEAAGRNRSVRLEASAPCTILADEVLLRRAIENVVRNAVQYTAEGTEVEVGLECIAGPNVDEGREGDSRSNQNGRGRRRDAAEGNAQRYAVITVRDHGPGVPADALEEIFRPFYRVDDARDRTAGGVGLGLAIADRSVRLHNGSVEAANADTGGLLVTLTLPIQ